MGQAWPHGICRCSAGPALGRGTDEARGAVPNPTPRREQGRIALPNTQTVGSKTILFIFLQLDPGLMIMKQRRTASPWQGDCRDHRRRGNKVQLRRGAGAFLGQSRLGEARREEALRSFKARLGPASSPGDPRDKPV